MPLDHDLKIELAERAEALMAPSERRLEMRHGSLPHYAGGFDLPGLFGVAVGAALVVGLGVCLGRAWPGAPGWAYLAPLVVGAIGGVRAGRGAERHVYWIIGEVRRGRSHG